MTGTGTGRLGVLLLAALAACGTGAPTLSTTEEPAARPSASATPGTAPTLTAAARAEGPSTPVVEPSATASDGPSAMPSDQPSAVADGPDLDGDGRADSVTLLEVPDMGWSFDVRLADGRETSAPLPDDDVVRADVAVLGAVDLDRDGADEVLVRTLRAVGGESAVVFRLDGDGVWLVRDREGTPLELSTSGGMTGPRSYECVGGVLLTRESERQEDGTYRAMTWRWTLDGHVAGPLGGARDDAVSAEDVALDPSTCAS